MSALLEKGTPIEHAGVSYIIGDELGSGSFGVVYLAECDGKLVAIKKTKQTLDDDRTNQQFRNEVFCLQYSNHQSIPAFIAAFQRLGYGYLVMAYVEGQDLDAYAKSHAVTEYEAVTIITSATDALQAMADRKPVVLHHDLKPDNIRISLTGTTHLLDFGSVGIGDQLLPTTKSIYSSPEQVHGDVVDQCGVIYALGATLFDILIDDLSIPIEGHDSESVRTLLLRKNVSVGLAMLVARMMHPEKAQRYQTFAELRAALDVVRRVLANAPQQPVRAVPTQELGAPSRPRAPTDPLEPKSTNPPPVPPTQPLWKSWVGLVQAVALIIIGLIMLFRAPVPPLPIAPTAVRQTGVPPTMELPTITPVPPTPTPPTVVTTVLPTFSISIDPTVFEPALLFDLPASIRGHAATGTEVQLVVDSVFTSPLVVSVATQDDGVWNWYPSPDAPALAAGDYTISASAIDPRSSTTVIALPLPFQIVLPLTVTLGMADRIYTEANPQATLMASPVPGTLLEVVGWTVGTTEEWYRVRTRTSRRLGWLQANQVLQPLTPDDKQRLPRMP